MTGIQVYEGDGVKPGRVAITVGWVTDKGLTQDIQYRTLGEAEEAILSMCYHAIKIAQDMATKDLSFQLDLANDGLDISASLRRMLETFGPRSFLPDGYGTYAVTRSPALYQIGIRLDWVVDADN